MIGIAVRAASEGVLVVGGPLSRNGRTDPPGEGYYQSSARGNGVTFVHRRLDAGI
jgi:hypothetical protein